MYIGFLF